MLWQKLHECEADIVWFVQAQSHDGGHMFPRQRQNAPAGLLPPLWSHEDPFMFIAVVTACALRGETLAMQSVLDVNVQLSLPRVFPFKFIELYSEQLKGKQLLTKFPTEGSTPHEQFIYNAF